jgi:hypothetical protein
MFPVSLRLNFVIHAAWHSSRCALGQGHTGLVTGRGGRTLADNFVWTVDGMLVAIGVLEIGKQTLGNMKGKRRTEKQGGRRGGFVLAMGGGRSDGFLAESHEGAVDSERGFGRSTLTRSSTFVLNFCRRLALASRWLFKPVEGRNHDEVGVS